MSWRAALLIEYDGGGFAGWQVQPGPRTVQGVVEDALQTVFRRRIRIVGAGRTDAGVHALGQVAHCDLPGTPAEGRSLRASLNGLTPASVVIRRIDPVSPNFHARFDAVWRHYRYRLTTEPVACERAYVWHVRAPLVRARLARCAAALPGAHDFRSFSVARSSAARGGTRCRVLACSWRKRGRELHFDIRGDRFLHGMVRSLVGAMIRVGTGQDDESHFRSRLAGREPPGAGFLVPARGLTLQAVGYPEASKTKRKGVENT